MIQSGKLISNHSDENHIEYLLNLAKKHSKYISDFDDYIVKYENIFNKYSEMRLDEISSNKPFEDFEENRK